MPLATQTQDDRKQGSPVDDDVEEHGSDHGTDDANAPLKPLLEDGGNGEYLRKMIMEWDIPVKNIK